MSILELENVEKIYGENDNQPELFTEQYLN